MQWTAAASLTALLDEEVSAEQLLADKTRGLGAR